MFCLLLNVINPLLQIFLLNLIFNGKFLDLGGQIIYNFPSSDAVGLFPTRAYCDYQKLGIKDKIQSSHTCILPYNSLLLMIFTLHWAVLVLTSVLNMFSLLNTILVYSLPTLRISQVWRNSSCFYLDVRKVVLSIDVNKWQLIYNSSQNMPSIVFRSIIEKIVVECIEEKDV